MLTDAFAASVEASAVGSKPEVAVPCVAREALSSSSRWRQSRKISAGLPSLSSDPPPAAQACFA
jgi:hypothetical protein